jgi:hypothetical protein
MARRSQHQSRNSEISYCVCLPSAKVPGARTRAARAKQDTTRPYTIKHLELGTCLSAQLIVTLKVTRRVSHRASTDGTCTPCTPAGCPCTRCKCRQGQMTQRLPAAWNPKWDSPVPGSRPPRRCHLSHPSPPCQHEPAFPRCHLATKRERDTERERESCACVCVVCVCVCAP